MIGPRHASELRNAVGRLYDLAYSQTTEDALDLRPPLCESSIDGSLPSVVRLLARAVADAHKDDRGLEVLERRYGLRDGERFTLDEIGGYLGLTRERARQLKERFRQRLLNVLAIRDEKLPYSIPPLVKRRLAAARAAFPFLEQIVLSERHCHTALTGDGKALESGEEGLIQLLLESWEWQRFTDPYGRGLWAYGLPKKDRKNLVKAMREVRRVLNKDGRALDLFTLVVEAARTGGKGLDKTVLERALTLLPEVESLGDGRYRIRFLDLPSPGHFARRVLEEAGEPLSFREIARRINMAAAAAGQPPRIDSPQRLAIQLSRRAWFRPIGRSGSWALAEWSEVRTEPIAELLKEALHFRQKAGSAVELHQHVIQGRPQVPLTTVYSLLCMHPDVFRRVAPGRYELAAWGGRSISGGRVSTATVGERLHTAVRAMVETHQHTTFPLAQLVRELSSQTGLADSALRARINRSDWAHKRRGPDGKWIVTVNREKLQTDQNTSKDRGPVTATIEQAVRSFLTGQPSGQAAVVDIWKHVCKVVRVKRPTVYKALDEMEGLTKFQKEGQPYCALETVSDPRTADRA